MAALRTRDYLLFQAKRRVPTINNMPGMGRVEKRLLEVDWKQHALAKPPAGSGLKPVMSDYGLPILGNYLEMFRGGPNYGLHLYRKHGPVYMAGAGGSVIASVSALGPDAIQAVFANKNKAFSQKGWQVPIGPFFNRGLMLLDFDEHLAHRRIMQEAFTRSQLAGYVRHMDRVAAQVVAHDWPANEPRFLFYPAAKELTLDIASLVFMGHEPGTDRDLLAKVNQAFTITTRAGNALIRYPVPPFKWWRGLRARKLLEEYFTDRLRERQNSEDNDLLAVLCRTEDEDGNSFTDADIVNHMIFLMMAAHDTSTSTTTTMAYHLAAHPEWQERARDESARLGDAPLDIESLEKLETLDLVMNESLRLVTPVWGLFRETVRDTDLLGHYLPARTHVTIWPGVNHLLPELWTEPRKFDPERFAEPRAEHKNHRYAFAPFGGGAHKCLGMIFGQLEVKTIVHRLLRRYRLELSRPGYQPRWDYAGMPVPMDGMPIVLRPLG